MQSDKRMTIVIVAALIVLLTASSTAAGLPVDQGGSEGEINVAATVLSKISYQGRLTDAGGSPLEGDYNLVFQFWDAATGGTQLGIDIVKWSVPVTNGMFTVKLDVPQDTFTGQAVWLQISIEQQVLSPRQEILPVPYALGLRPGGTISSPGPTALNAVNEAGGYGLKAQSQSNIGLLGVSGSGSYAPAGMHGVHGKGEGVGVYGLGGHTGVYGNGTVQGITGESSSGSGVVGETTAADKSGVYGHNTNGVGVRGRSETSAGVVGWTGASNDSGVYGHSQTGIGVSGRSAGSNGVLGVTSSSNTMHAGVWARNEGAGVAIFSEGDLHVTGAFRGDLGDIGGAPFPRPAYDSGWVAVPQAFTTLQHSLGGSVDSYFVDMWCKDDSASVGINQSGAGAQDATGASWLNLTSSSIVVRRYGDDPYCDSVRVRIWVAR